MTSPEPSNPVVHRLVAAINDGEGKGSKRSGKRELASPEEAIHSLSQVQGIVTR